jgi:hypothetical protein
VERLIRGNQTNEYKIEKLGVLQEANPDIDIISLELDSEGTTPFLLACVLGNEALASQLFDPAMAPLNRDHYLHPCYLQALRDTRENLPAEPAFVGSVWDDEMMQKAVALVGKLTNSELRQMEEEAALFGGRRTLKRIRSSNRNKTRRQSFLV